MNNIRILKTIEIRASRTIEILLIYSKNWNSIFYIYNYEGIHYRLFNCKKEVRKFFNCEDASYLDFCDDESLDDYLLNYIEDENSIWNIK